MRDDGPVGGRRGVGEEDLTKPRPTSPPASWAPMKNMADVGAMPAKVDDLDDPACLDTVGVRPICNDIERRGPIADRRT
jgi:hypothetical protein